MTSSALGPDEEAIEAWLEVGVPRERIVECPRSENFWQVGPTGPCGPCSELYLDRGVERGKPDDLPGGENERFLEYWNLVFMQFDQNPVNTLTPLPAKNIDTGLGLNRLASILQDKPTVFETDQFAPLISLGEELSGRRYGQEFDDRPGAPDPRRPRPRDDVPDRRWRGALQRGARLRAAADHAPRDPQGRALELEPGFLVRYADVVTELMGARISRACRSSDDASASGWSPRRRASAGRSRRGASCSTS